ncbi:type II toxin-antitoxin system Phd/YefM family antitoxin [Phenylobacterium sp.]|uniref:type II toxin-antitoxin system Phd/YefM family antitoxin n=1 Tax=Phenylobacterium sp. TaxID=1871053 RepID=UPI0025F7ACBA|nr:type II toxin-antitoxin system prevent-host-death family antitoxin [Phenylobacterium sp.]MBX3483260.1 type II toxin-antitoxin system prevent-host-death family antitoxin [Phenylobacterium sp.]MCW5759024.1 type II toxin-antitoxin system prevent-host-death family antitoxin [Phenylobacterium sp.]
MSRYSVVEAKNNLSELIARARKGEEVVITRHGSPVVEIKPVQAAQRPPRRTPAETLAWLDSVRIKLAPGAADSATLVRQMRDEGY